MPKRTDIGTILILGSGPIVIGQGCEFDYSGTQACKALKAEGYRVVLVNSNPATIMTDPEFSDRTYIEPITPEAVRKVLAKQRAIGDPVHALLPTLGGQTALNCACRLFDDGVLDEFGVEMIGADRRVIHRAEDRQAFKEIVEGLGLKMPRARTVNSLADAREFLKEIGLPAIIRPAFTLGGTGGGIAYNTEEFDDIVVRGLRASMIGQVQIDQSVLGWKEYELEVVRDRKDNCIIVCGIENIDPMGVHTGDSVTVAPILTLTDKEYQAMRDAAIAIMRAVGVETGGSNVQFAVNPDPQPDAQRKRRFEMVVVEMNPRVSRSSALASKATGFPIAKIAAKLAVGYTLDELRNDVTGTTSACFEPAIDYVVTKIPRFTFEKFPEADQTLTTQMKAVGEAMAIGRTFAESFQKAIRSMEVKRFGYGLDRNDKWLVARRHAGGADAPRTADNEPAEWPIPEEKLSQKLAVPGQARLYYVRYAFKMGWTPERVHELTKIDPWFLDQLKRLVEFEDTLLAYPTLESVPAPVLAEAKRLGYSDPQLANVYLGKISPEAILAVRARRKALGIEPVYKLVDTCAAEFEATTPYFYSTYEHGHTMSGGVAEWQSGRVGGHAAADAAATTPAHSATQPLVHSATPAEDEIRVTDKPKIVIIGGGPNRIGQGIEFDYCCVHASFAARELGFESVMINSNPETVSTDYDTSDLLFFEPLTLEDTLNVIERLNGGPLSSGQVAKWQSGKVAEGRTNGGPPRATPAHSATPPLGHSATGLVHGTIVQFGGQTPLNLAKGLLQAGAPIIGTSVDSIDLAEDRDRFDALLSELGLRKPPSGIARSTEQAVEIAGRIGYPVLVRPSYVLGGRGMEICSDERALRSYMTTGLAASDLESAPVLIDRFLSDAVEVDVDVVADFGSDGVTKARSDGVEDAPAPSSSPTPSLRHSVTPSLPTAIIAGVMEHIEEAGIHSGDSACTIPPYSLAPAMVRRIEEIGRRLAKALKIRGLMNAQLAIKGDEIYVLEVNPRASRTVPFVAKATQVPWARVAAKVMMGRPLSSLGVKEVATIDGQPALPYFSVKEVVFPFGKFPGVDVVLGPEMRSTGEVMGADRTFELAFAKAQMGAGVWLPTSGNVFISVRETDRPKIHAVARQLVAMGFTIFASTGTGEHLERSGVRATILPKIASGLRGHVLDLMADGKVQLIINTPTRTGWNTDEGRIRSSAVRLNVPMITTVTGAAAAVRAIAALRAGDAPGSAGAAPPGGWGVMAMQDYRDLLPEAHPARHAPTGRPGVGEIKVQAGPPVSAKV
jgi:carbamoyl-phosphate synthase large subunit